ncbi:hypothetical protein Tco_0560489 [Tanacetum coccineum]
MGGIANEWQIIKLREIVEEGGMFIHGVSRGKSICKTEAEEAEAARQVHATYHREFPYLYSQKNMRLQTFQILKKARNKHRQPVVSATSSEGTGTKLGVPDEEKDIIEENVILEWGSEQEIEYSEEDELDDEKKDDKEGDANDEDDETEFDKDDTYYYKIRVCIDEDKEMLNAEVKDPDKGDEEVTDAAKADAEKTSEVKDDAKKTELPLKSSSLSVSSGFGDQFLKLSSDSSLVSTVKDTTDAKINSLLEPSVLTPVQESPLIDTIITLPLPSVSTTPLVPQQTTTTIPTPTITTDAPIITTAVSESDALSAVQLRVAKLEKDVSELKKIDLSAEALAALKTQVPSVVDNYLGSKQIPELPKKQTPTVDLEQESEKTPSEILKIKKEQAEKQKMPKFTIKSTDKAALKDLCMKMNNPGKEIVTSLICLKPLPLQSHTRSSKRMLQITSSTMKLEVFKSSDPESSILDNHRRTKSKLGRKLWHISQLNKFSKHNVYSTKKILAVKSVSVKKLHGYGHLEEIVVKRADPWCKELPEESQHHFTSTDLFRNIIQELYTPSHKPPGVIYEDLTKQKRVMRADELYMSRRKRTRKVRDELHQNLTRLFVGIQYIDAKEKWMAIERKKVRNLWSRWLIDKQMRGKKESFEILKDWLVLGTREWNTILMTRTT